MGAPYRRGRRLAEVRPSPSVVVVGAVKAASVRHTVDVRLAVDVHVRGARAIIGPVGGTHEEEAQ